MKSFMGSVTRSKNTDVEQMRVEMRAVHLLLNEGLFLAILGKKKKKMSCNLVPLNGLQTKEPLQGVCSRN